MSEKDIYNELHSKDNQINYREVLDKYLAYWKWFALSILITYGISFVYLRYTPNQYEVATTILIEDENNNGLVSDLRALEEIGVVGNNKTLVENEIGVLKSYTLMESVAKDLNLNIRYFGEGKIRTSEIYNERCPIKVNFFEKDSTFYKADTTFVVKINSDNTLVLHSDLNPQEVKAEFGQNINTTIGNMTITPNEIFAASRWDIDEVIVKISPLRKVVDNYKDKIEIEFLLKGADILKISLRDKVNQKAALILNQLTKSYNENAVALKSTIAINTKDFIDQRLKVIERDLSLIDKGVQDFKISNNITDIPTESSLILNSATRIENEIIDINTRIKLVEYILEYLSNNPDEVLPANLILGENSLQENSRRYNEILIERNRILNSSKEMNPVIQNLNTQVTELRQSVVQSLVNLKSTLEISLDHLQEEEKRLRKRIQAVPIQERRFRDIERQQKIIEALYLFLLQKREENAISIAATMPNAKIIDKARVALRPVSPVKPIIKIGALLLGFLIPFGILFIRFLFDNTVTGLKDFETKIGAPVLGEIPRDKKGVDVLIQDTGFIMESFRMLRTNLSYMLNEKKDEPKVIAVTSTVPGEGKTYTSINLSSIISLSKKKVLLIGADVRKPQIANYLNFPKSKTGLVNYLMDDQLDIKSIITHYPDANIDIIQSGIVPPNPAELIMSARFDEVIKYGKENYDYVIIDTPPINFVSDTLLLSDKADLWLYIIRANYLDKRLLEIPERIFKEKKLPRMALVLNNTDPKRGNMYGYAYGYNYAYSYGKERNSPLSRLKERIKEFFS